MTYSTFRCYTFKHCLVASVADKAGKPSASRKRFIMFNILFWVLIKIFKYMLKIDPENLHPAHNANCVRATGKPQYLLLYLYELIINVWKVLAY